MGNTIKRFRVVALAEGLSYIALLFIAMPLKYKMDMPIAVSVVGMIHGILFIAYIITAIPLFTKLKWDVERLPAVIGAALIPFGTFWLDRRYLREPST